MKNLVKAKLVALTALLAIGTLVYGQSLTPNPSTVPKHAYINTADDEVHYYFQVVTYTVGTPPTAAADLELNLPADGSITVADTDGDTNYDDEIALIENSSTVVSVKAATSASQIVIGTVAGLTAADVIYIIFPVETDSTLATTSKVPYNLTTSTLDGDHGYVGTDSVSFAAEVRPVNLFATNLENDGDGSVSTDNKGEYHPSTAAAFTGAMTNFIVDGFGAGTFVDDGSGWAGLVLSGTDNDVPYTPLVNMEVYYELWASQTEGLKYLNTGVAQKLYRYNAGTEIYADNFAEGTAMTDALRVDGLTEGVWYIYIASNLSADWAIGQSDSLVVKHYPVFVDPDVGLTPLWQYDDVTDGDGGAGQGIDYDHDNVFEPTTATAPTGTANGDDATQIYLDTGEIYGRDGNFVQSSNSYDNVRIYWHGQDVDDPSATVQVFYSTSNSLTTSDIQVNGSGNVTGLAGATEITFSPMDLDGPTNYVTYTISQDPLQTAGTYYFYLVANDLTNQTLQIVTDYDGAANPVALTAYIKHSPYLEFQDVYSAQVTAGGIAVNSASTEHIVISWGETITSARDIDATPAEPLTIDLYHARNNMDGGGTIDGTYGTLVTDPLDPSTLTGASNVTHIVTVEDTSDEQLNNAYMWDFRNEATALSAYGVDPNDNEYFIYAVVSQGDDEVVVQYNSDGYPGPTTTDDRGFQFTHGQFFQGISPVPNTSTELVVRDHYRFEWNAFDVDGTGGFIQAFISPTVTATDFSATAWNAIAAAEGLYWVTITGTNTDGSSQPALNEGWTPSTGYGVLDVSDLTEDTDGAPVEGARPAAWESLRTGGDAGAIGTEYDVWYYYTSAGAGFTAETPVKAQGTLFFSLEDPGTAQNIRIVPNKPMTAAVGEQITFAVEVNSGGANVGALTIAIDVPADNLSVVDQGSGPFSGFIGTFNTATLNNASTVGSTVELDLALTGTAQAMAWGTTVATFKVQVTDNPAGESPLHISVDFVDDSDTRVTSIYDANILPVLTSWDTPSADVSLVRPGKIYGIVEVEGREDSPAQEVSLLLVPTGSISPLTASAYVDANDDDSDGSNGAQLTLDSDGEYELTQVPTGEYDLIARKGGFLDQLESSVWVYPFGATEVNFLDGNKLFGGDAAGYDHDGDDNAVTLDLGDNQIDASDDAPAFDDAMTATPDSSFWNALADITGDDLIWADDWAIMVKNQNRTSEGVTYKAIPISSSGNPIASLDLISEAGDEKTYAVSMSQASGMRGYAVKLGITPSDWELVSYEDGLASHYPALDMNKSLGYDELFISATMGINPINSDEIEILAVTVRSLTSDPEAISISSAEIVGLDGKMSKAVVSGSAELPMEFVLSQNYPNPFNPTTTINFALPAPGEVKLAVYNLLGQEVQTLVSGSMESGSYTAVWNSVDNFGQKVSSGVYFYRLEVDGKTIATKKMLMLK